MILFAVAVILIALYTFRPRAKRWTVQFEAPYKPGTTSSMEYTDEREAKKMANFMLAVGVKYVSVKGE